MGEKLTASLSCNTNRGICRKILCADSANKTDNAESDHNAAHGEYNALVGRGLRIYSFVDYLRYRKGNEQFKDRFKHFEEGS